MYVTFIGLQMVVDFVGDAKTTHASTRLPVARKEQRLFLDYRCREEIALTPEYAALLPGYGAQVHRMRRPK